MRKQNWIVVAVAVACISLAAYGLTKMTSIWIVNSQIDSTPIGSVTPSTGRFTTASASGGFTGNLAGNASTATALAATPTQCGGSTPVATGVQANGNANCISQPFVQAGITNIGCTTGSSSFDVCSMSVNWLTPFADANYGVSCTGVGPSDSGNPTSGRAQENGITFQSRYGVTVQFTTAGSHSISFSGMSCIAVHP